MSFTMGSPVHSNQIIASSLMIENDFDIEPSGISSTTPSNNKKKGVKWLLLSVYLTCLLIGGIGGPLVQRLYYNHGGNRKWLMCFLQSAGFPILIIPLVFLSEKDRASSRSTSKIMMLVTMDARLFYFGILLGVLSGIANYMYSVGLFYLPVSTLSLLYSTNLAFLAVFSFLIVRQKFTFYSINAVVLLTLGAVVLALHSSSDRPAGVSKGKYLFGFIMTLGGAVAFGLMFPGVEFAYKRSRRPITIMTVTQFQFVINLFASIFCIVGMLINKDFQVMKREAGQFELGEVKYYVVLVALAILWQLAVVGLIGIVHCTTSLFTGIASAALLPLLEVAAVLSFHEKFTGEKGMCLALCLWGFTSYFVGEYKTANKKIDANETKPSDM